MVAKEDCLQLIRTGVDAWNSWRASNPCTIPDLSGANLKYGKLSGINFSDAILDQACLTGAELVGANLERASLKATNVSGAYDKPPNLTGANLRFVNAENATFKFANLHRINFDNAILANSVMKDAHLDGASIRKASLRKADLRSINFEDVDLTESDLSGSCMYGAKFINARLDRANLTCCEVFGVAVWNTSLTDAIQENLVVTHFQEPKITVDNLEIAQFIHTILKDRGVRAAIDAITQKVCLILGRFTDERRRVLGAVQVALRNRGYVPIVVDFEIPNTRDITETVSTLAHLSRFVIADLTDAKSIPQELGKIVPSLPSVPIIPLVQQDDEEYAMFEHFRRFPWVMGVHRYRDDRDLVQAISGTLIASAEKLAGRT